MEDGELVLLTDEDFEAAQAERRRTLEVSDFVPLEEIDPYFARTYTPLPRPARRTCISCWYARSSSQA